MSLTVDGYRLQIKAAMKVRNRHRYARTYIKYCILRIRELERVRQLIALNLGDSRK
jgi:hypothetical protein